MENDLRQPLKRRSLWQRVLSSRPSALRTVSFVSIASLAGLGSWLVLTHEPYGGEPVVHMRINTSDPIITSSLNKPATPESGSQAASEDQADPAETGSDTPIIDLSELGSRGDDNSDLARRKRELLAKSGNDQNDQVVESPSDALSMDDLAPSREAVAPSSVARSLIPAPVAKVTGKGAHGSLPRKAKDGTTPARIYARPVPREQLASNMPKIALLIGGMGLNHSLTDAAIKTLPPEISLAFAPYGEDLQTQANKARARGHELFLQLPMEPFGYPSIDPGPRTLLTSVTPQKNIDSLHWHLSRFAGFAGVTNYLGAQFASNDRAMAPVLRELAQRGLVYIDDGSKGLSRATRLATSQGLQARSALVSLDGGDGSQAAILAALQQLEAQAKKNGFAIATGSGLPNTIEAIAKWSQGLAGRNIMLVPASAAFAARRS